jgi:hypothetical protein
LEIKLLRGRVAVVILELDLHIQAVALGGILLDDLPRERDAAERRLHRIDAERFDVDCDDAGIERASNPCLEAIDAAHDFIARPLDLGCARLLDTGRRE